MGDIGIGIDIEEIDRFNDCLDDRRFLQKMFTEKEIKLLKKEHAIPSVAARFCAKEAIIKAFGTCGRTIQFQDIEIFKNEQGVPYALQYKYKGYTIKISLSHTDTIATAIALIMER